MSWVYVKSEPGLWTVGHYDYVGDWHTDSDHGSAADAGERVAYLNGALAGNGALIRRVDAIEQQLDELDARTPYPDGATI